MLATGNWQICYDCKEQNIICFKTPNANTDLLLKKLRNPTKMLVHSCRDDYSSQ